MTSAYSSGGQEPLHCSEWQKAEFFFQLRPKLCLCPLLQRQTDTQTADTYIIRASSNGKIPRETFPCCHRVVPWIVSCKYACASGNRDSPSPSQGRVFGRSGLKTGTGSFVSTCLWSVHKQLVILNSKLFYSLSISWSFRLKWTLCCAHLILRSWYYICVSVYQKYYCITIYCSVWLCFYFKLTWMWTGHLLVSFPPHVAYPWRWS